MAIPDNKDPAVSTSEIDYPFVETMLESVGVSTADFDALKAIPATQTGTGSMVLATSPTLVTPTLGVATATTVNAGTGGYKVSNTKVLGAQAAAIADATGGATIDAEARTALNDILAKLRTHGIIAT